MATGTASPNYDGTLTANTVDTIAMDRGWDTIQIINEDTALTIWYTVDGSTPAVGGATGGTARVLPPQTVDTPLIPNSVAVVVKLISSGTPKYAIEGGS